jgi:hypothetical protein
MMLFTMTIILIRERETERVHYTAYRKKGERKNKLTTDCFSLPVCGIASGNFALHCSDHIIIVMMETYDTVIKVEKE